MPWGRVLIIVSFNYIEQMLIVHVRDNGEGIEAQHVDSLFQDSSIIKQEND